MMNYTKESNFGVAVVKLAVINTRIVLSVLAAARSFPNGHQLSLQVPSRLQQKQVTFSVNPFKDTT